ncbi:hypothetical protein PLICRDRAFT_180638 [Plicaturopsis crispa FD-325 SS-3]|uniref:Uncharacterized protein n=1 Tax=Plicaturopsis crispa FD-325 SS-3 TaxID=944288 RepID=A0A0C9T219_PLICR|nr:hypothetical protein PLICRDRAFT_180638 [Plicaturopsis crispa FD-325 SS-3]
MSNRRISQSSVASTPPRVLEVEDGEISDDSHAAPVPFSTEAASPQSGPLPSGICTTSASTVASLPSSPHPATLTSQVSAPHQSGTSSVPIGVPDIKTQADLNLKLGSNVEHRPERGSSSGWSARAETNDQRADRDMEDTTSKGLPALPPREPISNALNMSPADLDRAKSLVLDLLGWGVAPEYLLSCGVSPQALYVIFTELRLRLPDGLVVLNGEVAMDGGPANTVGDGAVDVKMDTTADRAEGK